MNLYHGIMMAIATLSFCQPTTKCHIKPGLVLARESKAVEIVAGSSPDKAGVTRCFVQFSKSSDFAQKVASIISYDLSFTGQFKAKFAGVDADVMQGASKPFFDKGVDLVINLEPLASQDKATCKIRVVAKQTWNDEVVAERINLCSVQTPVGVAHELSNWLLTELTGKGGMCTSTLAWCENSKIMMSDAAFQIRKTINATTGTKCGLSWHTQAPVLFFSEAMGSKHELRQMNVKTGLSGSCFSFPGLNMQFSPSLDGKSGVLCMTTKQGNTELFLYDEKKKKKDDQFELTQLTHNGATNVSPCYLPNGNLVYCSDRGSGSPQLYYLNRSTGKTVRISEGGYAACPSYCAKNNAVIFSRPVNQTLQLFYVSLDRIEKGKVSRAQQITFSAGDKTEPQWHENGGFIAFVYDFVNKEKIRENQIAVLNFLNGEIRCITSGPEKKGFPAWTARQLCRA